VREEALVRLAQHRFAVVDADDPQRRRIIGQRNARAAKLRTALLQ
jgi:hypothetical protein